jgi:hypothetical protein
MPHPVPENGFIQIKSMYATTFARTEAMRPKLRSPDSSVQMATILNGFTHSTTHQTTEYMMPINITWNIHSLKPNVWATYH